MNVDEYFEAVAAVLDAVDVRLTHVLGHHGGCMLGVNIATNDPDRVSKLVPSGSGISDPTIAERLLNNPMTRDLPMDAEGEYLTQTWAVYQSMSAPETFLETTFLAVRYRTESEAPAV